MKAKLLVISFILSGCEPKLEKPFYLVCDVKEQILSGPRTGDVTRATRTFLIDSEKKEISEFEDVIGWDVQCDGPSCSRTWVGNQIEMELDYVMGPFDGRYTTNIDLDSLTIREEGGGGFDDGVVDRSSTERMEGTCKKFADDPTKAT